MNLASTAKQNTSDVSANPWTFRPHLSRHAAHEDFGDGEGITTKPCKAGAQQ